MKEHIKNIGKIGILHLEGFPVEVEITSVRQAFGRIDYEITVSGDNTVHKYVDSKRIMITGNSPHKQIQAREAGK